MAAKWVDLMVLRQVVCWAVSKVEPRAEKMVVVLVDLRVFLSVEASVVLSVEKWVVSLAAKTVAKMADLTVAQRAARRAEKSVA
jgi:hypothetical protein